MRPGGWGEEMRLYTDGFAREGKRNLIFLRKNAIQYVATALFATLFCSLSIPERYPFPSSPHSLYIKRLLSFHGKNIAGIVAVTRKFRYRSNNFHPPHPPPPSFPPFF